MSGDRIYALESVSWSLLKMVIVSAVATIGRCRLGRAGRRTVTSARGKGNTVRGMEGLELVGGSISVSEVFFTFGRGRGRGFFTIGSGSSPSEVNFEVFALSRGESFGLGIGVSSMEVRVKGGGRADGVKFEIEESLSDATLGTKSLNTIILDASAIFCGGGDPLGA